MFDHGPMQGICDPDTKILDYIATADWGHPEEHEVITSPSFGDTPQLTLGRRYYGDEKGTD